MKAESPDARLCTDATDPGAAESPYIRAARRAFRLVLPGPGARRWTVVRWVFWRVPLDSLRRARLINRLTFRGFFGEVPDIIPARRETLRRPQDVWPTDLPLVSIVIPNFNYGRFIEATVDSVLDQTFDDIEILIVDGGSDDPDTRRLLERATWPKTTTYLREGRHLAGANRNFGIERARGKYFCCLDADDQLDPTYLEKALFLLETQGYDIVSTAIGAFGEDTGNFGVLRYPALENMLRANEVATCAVVRRSLWEESGGFVDTGRGPDLIFEDWRLWVRMAALGGRIANLIDEPLLRYRVHSKSLSRAAGVAPMHVQREAIERANSDVISPQAIEQSARSRDVRVVVEEPWANIAPRSVADDRPTVLLVMPFMILGGAERLLSEITAGLLDRRLRVVIVTTEIPNPSGGSTKAWFRRSTEEVFELPRFLEPNLWYEFIRHQIGVKNVSVVWCAGSPLLYRHLTLLRAEFPDVRVVDLLFNTVGHAPTNRMVAECIDLTIVENQEVMQWLTERGEDTSRVQIIPSGVDLEVLIPASSVAIRHKRAELGLPPDAFVVGFSSRFSHEKSPETVIRVAEQLRDADDVHFVMTGAGPLESEVRQRIARRRLRHSVHLLGAVDDVHSVMAVYDVLFLPSRFDGRPMVVLESLAMGIPVLASRVGALPELIREGTTGFLCEPGDIMAFADRIRWMAAHRAELTPLRSAARTMATEELDARVMIDRYAAALVGTQPLRQEQRGE